MDERLTRLEAKVEKLSHRIEQLETALRSAHLEHEVPTPIMSSSPDAEEVGEVPDVLSGSRQLISVLTLIGRTLLILGGAYLWRHGTDLGLVSRPLGTALGLVYAFAWIVLAHLSAARGRRLSTAFHIGTSVVVAVPLLWEATFRFEVYSGWQSAMILGVSGVVTLVIACRWRLQEVAWIYPLPAALLAIALSVATAEFTPFTCTLLALGFASLWSGYLMGWHGLAAVLAATVDLVLVLLTLAVALAENASEAILPPGQLSLLQLTLLLGYVGSISTRTLLRRREVIGVELFQTLAAVVVGAIGPLILANVHGVSVVPLGITSACLAVAFYGFAFSVIDRRKGTRRSFIYYATLAIACTVTAVPIFLDDPYVAVAFGALTVTSGYLATRHLRVTLVGHAAIYAVAAAIAAGLPTVVLDSFLGTIAPLVWWSGTEVVAALAATLFTCCLLTPSHRRTWGRFSHLPKVVLLLLNLGSVNALAVSAGQHVLLLFDGELADLAVRTGLGTWVLTILIVLIAWASRFERYHEASWLVYPLLLLGAVKLLVGDFVEGSFATLCVSFALFGVALILAPRLLRARWRERPRAAARVAERGVGEAHSGRVPA